MSWKGGYMRMVEFKPRQSKPLQLAMAIAGDIQTGKLKVGDYMPKLQDLADINGVSVSTVATAYQLLKNKDIIGKDLARRYRVMNWPTKLSR